MRDPSGDDVTMRSVEEASVAAARRWLTLAAGSLVVAGLLSLLLVLGRVPFLPKPTQDPLFFRRCLVVHVDLSLAVWLHAFGAGLFCLLPARRRPSTVARAAFWLAVAAVAMLVLSAGARDAVPVLANYLPVIDHPLYAAGLAFFGVAVALSFADGRLLARSEAGGGLLPDAARPGVRAFAVAFVLALLTFGAAWLKTPRTIDAAPYFENLMWGGGHVLQFASVAAMMVAWIVLLTPVLGRAPVSRPVAAWLFALLVTPLFGAPLLALGGTDGLRYRSGFTTLMQWGVFPPVLLLLGACVAALVRGRRAGTLRTPLTDARVTGFAASAALSVVGFVLGAMIRGSTTVVPAHYHAAIGAVTLAFMAVTFPLLAPLGLPLATARQRTLARWQPVLFGAGQLVFALGFALAGAHGMGRKVYAAEQHVRTVGEWVGLGLVGVGGLVAVAGGLLYLALFALAWSARLSARSAGERNDAWKVRDPSIPSRS